MVEPHAGCLPPGLKHCSGGRKGHLGQGWKDCPGAPAPITVHGCMSWWTRAEPQDSWDHVLRKQSDTYHLFIPQLFTECLQHVQRWARHLGQGQPCPHGAGLPAVTEPDGGLPTLRPSGGNRESSQSWRPTPATPSPNCSLGHGGLPPLFRFLSSFLHALPTGASVSSLTVPWSAHFVRTLPLLPDSTQTPNPLGRRLRPSWAKLAAVSSVCPVWFL